MEHTGKPLCRGDNGAEGWRGTVSPGHGHLEKDILKGTVGANGVPGGFENQQGGDGGWKSEAGEDDVRHRALDATASDTGSSGGF